MIAEELRVFEDIFAVVRQIPAGKVATYGQVGKLAGGYSGRVAGFAMASLRWRNEGDVPWHRVINRLGKLSLKSFDGGLQRSLLEGEGIRFDSNNSINLARYQWDGYS
jgi:methylated-DNA-protein-cysteine methyltransferase-like protein